MVLHPFGDSQSENGGMSESFIDAIATVLPFSLMHLSHVHLSKTAAYSARVIPMPARFI